MGKTNSGRFVNRLPRSSDIIQSVPLRLRAELLHTLYVVFGGSDVKMIIFVLSSQR